MFHSDCDLRVLPHRPGYWRVLGTLIWDDGGFRHEVPEGTETDLASIPGVLARVPILAAPWCLDLDKTGRSRRPAVLHDDLYATGVVDRKTADNLLYAAMLLEGCTARSAWAYYTAVRSCGWRPWNRYRAASRARDSIEV